MKFGDMDRLDILHKTYGVRKNYKVIRGRGVDVKGQIFNFVRFRRLRCQIVRLGPAIERCHGDPDVRPFLRGQRSPERSYFQLCPISTVEVSNCSSRSSDWKLSWRPRRPTLSSGSKVTRNVKFSTLSDFDDRGVKLYVSAQRSKNVMVTPTSDLFFGVKVHQKGHIFNFVRFSKVEVSNCSSWSSDWKLSWRPRRPTLSSGSKVTRKVKFSTLSDFDG